MRGCFLSYKGPSFTNNEEAFTNEEDAKQVILCEHVYTSFFHDKSVGQARWNQENIDR